MMAVAGTYIQYGDVKLFRVVTHEIRQQQVFDPTGTDLLYQKTTIRVSGFLHGHANWSYLHQIPYVNDGTGVSTAHRLVRYQLPPRQRFIMAIGAVSDVLGGMAPASAPVTNVPITLFDVSPMPTRLQTPQVIDGEPIYGNINMYRKDLANGPKCIEFSVTHVTGNELFAVDATFELCTLECTGDGSVPFNRYGVLSNRWSIADSLDVNMRTTRTYRGTMVLASANINAQALRWMVAPPLQPLFRRDRMEFTWEADGLTLHWSVTDQEIAAAAPFPARKWSVNHTIRTEEAMMGASSIQIYVEGDSNVNKTDLIEICMWVVTAKMFGKTPIELAAGRVDNDVINGQAISYIVDHLEFTDHTGDLNAISANAQVRSPLDAHDGMALALRTFGQAIEKKHLPAPLDGTQGGVGANFPYNQNTGEPYNKAKSWGGYAGQIPAVEGPAQIVGIVACFLQGPCTDGHALNDQYNIAQRNEASQNPVSQTPYTATESTRLQTTQNSNATPYSASHLESPYTFWQVDNTYKTRGMRVQHPIAKANASSTGQEYKATSAFVTLAGAQTYRVIRVSAERVGDWPQFANPERILQWPYPASPLPAGYIPLTQKYLRHVIKPGRSTTTATGQVIFRAQMEIVLGLSRPPTPEEKLALGIEKWSNKGPQTTSSTLTNSDWSQ